MAGQSSDAALLQKTKLVLRNCDKASFEEIADVIDDELGSGSGDNFRGKYSSCIFFDFNAFICTPIIAHINLKLSQISCFVVAQVDGKWFLKITEEEKKEFFPGFAQMGKRRHLTQLIQYAQMVRFLFFFGVKHSYF